MLEAEAGNLGSRPGSPVVSEGSTTRTGPPEGSPGEVLAEDRLLWEFWLNHGLEAASGTWPLGPTCSFLFCPRAMATQRTRVLVVLARVGVHARLGCFSCPLSPGFLSVPCDDLGSSSER